MSNCGKKSTGPQQQDSAGATLTGRLQWETSPPIPTREVGCIPRACGASALGHAVPRGEPVICITTLSCCCDQRQCSVQQYNRYAHHCEPAFSVCTVAWEWHGTVPIPRRCVGQHDLHGLINNLFPLEL
jgi:hypothetical protein